MRLKPIRKSRLYEGAVDQIRSLILAHNYKPGDRLPSERELAEQLSVGRPSVREALRILGAMGLIEIRIGDGTYVRDATLLPYLDSLITLISSRLSSQEENILKLWEVRRILEGGTVCLACSRMTSQRLKRMEDCLRKMEENLHSRDVFTSTGVQFHQEIAEATGNEILLLIWKNLWDMILRSDLYRRRTRRHFRMLHAPQKSLQEHKIILRALKKGDLRLSLRAMEQHLEQEENAFRKTMKRGARAGNGRVRRSVEE